MEQLLRDTKSQLNNEKGEGYAGNEQSNSAGIDRKPTVPIVDENNPDQQVIELNGKRYIVIKELDNDEQAPNQNDEES